ncbi:DUF397 domain-containing protein [Spirillospora albida]|uniref:DUF397 domain-containing protein n=1 Tax=Spirillospora albida TaxID=58123 RepID=UPI0009FE22A4|nr:DUF397 domain-containing protein [Spirillospora albida]
MDGRKTDVSAAKWRKSSHSSANGECVEVTDLAGSAGVRDSKAPDAGHLTFGVKSWKTFTAQVRAGHYDR